jgi:hypothetical protein
MKKEEFIYKAQQVEDLSVPPLLQSFNKYFLSFCMKLGTG